MLKHYLLSAIRSFYRFRTPFFINVLGLSSALFCTALIYLWVSDELAVDTFHDKGDRLYKVMRKAPRSGALSVSENIPGQLAETLKQRIPEVENTVSTTWISRRTISVNDKPQHAKGYYVGPEFFKVFSYPIISGTQPKQDGSKTEMAISEKLAVQLFGGVEAAVGQVITYENEKNFIVHAVFEDIPKNSSFQFDFVLPYEVYKDDNQWAMSWYNNGPLAYLTLKPGTNPEEVSKKIRDIIQQFNPESTSQLFLKKYEDHYLYDEYDNGVISGGRIVYIRLFSLIALAILAMACINFINLTTAKATERAKEIGVKKALGAAKKHIVNQYLTEGILVNVLSFFIAFVAVTLFLPEFNNITEKKLGLSLTVQSLTIWVGLAILPGLLAGTYPALQMGSFKPVSALKGIVKGSFGEVLARKGLVIFQFAASSALIVGVLVVQRQINFLQTKDLGFSHEKVITIEATGKLADASPVLLEEVRNIPGVSRVSALRHSFVGRNNNTTDVNWPGKNPDDRVLFENISGDHQLIDALGMKIIEGRGFNPNLSTDSAKVIFNESAIKMMGLTDPLGKKVKLWRNDYEIIGVVQDFHFQSLHHHVQPALILLIPDHPWQIAIQVESQQLSQIITDLEQLYQKLNPEFIFDYQLLTDMIGEQYRAEEKVGTLSKYFAGFAIIISCLGLFGLATFTIERRIKEIGIRKVLGSSNRAIVFLFTSNFTKPVLWASAIGLVGSYLWFSQWLEGFAYRTELEIWLFVASGFLAICIAWLSVGWQAIRAAHTSPAKCLRAD